MSRHVASAESRERTAVLLADLWSRNRPVVEGRLEILERATQSPLTDETRLEAQGVAHKLAGSLGMFGLPEGTEIARELELLLDYSSPQSADILRLVTQLRVVLAAKS